MAIRTASDHVTFYGCLTREFGITRGRIPAEERFAGRRVNVVEMDNSSCGKVIFITGENLVPSQS